MRSLPIIGLCLLVITVSQSQADAQMTEGDLKALFLRLDANNDQVIEKSEVPESAIPAFTKLLTLADTDKNGKLEAEEARELGRQLPSSIVPATRFKAMDKNGDEKIHRDEFLGPPARFDLLDKNKDGFVDEKEFDSTATPSQPGQMLMEMDKDGDGKVSRVEYTGPPGLFDRLDADSDGQIEKGEAIKVVAANYQRLAAMDKNRDGKLSREEFKGIPARFDVLDADKDGFVSFQELPGGRKIGALKKFNAIKPKKSPSN